MHASGHFTWTSSLPDAQVYHVICVRVSNDPTICVSQINTGILLTQLIKTQWIEWKIGLKN